jgi:glycosyltransferase involved in cell wall biosynthesis
MIYTLTPVEGCFPGVHRHLSECEIFGTKHIYLNQLNQVTDQDTIIFGAWTPEYSMALRRCRAKKKALLFTSPLLQAQMNEPELSFLDTILDLKEKGIIEYVLFADLETYEVFKGLESGIAHLPHPADPKKIEPYILEPNFYTGEQKKDIFMYLPWGNKNKNQMVQLAAVKLFQRHNMGVKFHANGMGPWTTWADRLRIDYCDQGYLQRDFYYASIFMKKCGLHVTLSESFAYGVLDAFLLEVPVVCSPAIDWVPPSLIVRNPDDPVEIAELLDKVYNSNNPAYGKAAKKAALSKVERNNIKVKEVLDTIFS